MAEEILAGGVGNAGQVVRIGNTVRRPWKPSTAASHALLAQLADREPGVAPVPLGRDDLGREQLEYLDGDVAVPPYPPWTAGEPYLASIGVLLRRIHDALAGWRPPGGAVWGSELADPHGGPLIVHADICPDNIIARDGKAVAIIDWEFAAPGRPIWDVVSTARLCVPFTAPSRRDPIFAGLDVTARLHVLLDAYGLSDADRRAFAPVLRERRQVGERFVRGRVSAGEPAFRERWATAAGTARLADERAWVEAVPEEVACR